MEPNDLRVEIELRRKKAMDLKLRETLWTLYSSHLKHYTAQLKKDPSMVYPEIRETFEDSESIESSKIASVLRNLKDTIRSKADEELYDILCVHSQEYTFDALEVVRDEFRRRQLPLRRIAASSVGKLERVSHYVQFRVEGITYRVSCKEGLSSGSEVENFQGTTTTPMTIALLVDQQRVFEFKVKQVVRVTPEMPFFSEIMGEVTSFIDGDWVVSIDELLQKIKKHENCLRNERQAPKMQANLLEEMKRFGL